MNLLNSGNVHLTIDWRSFVPEVTMLLARRASMTAVLFGMLSCAVDVPTGSTRLPIALVGNPIWYNSSQYTGPDYHGGTTAAVVTNVRCFDPTAEPMTLFSAWKERRTQTDRPTGVLFGMSCIPPNGPNEPVNAGTRLTAAMTGTPPEWNSMTPMTILGEPYLYALGPSGWTVLIALVGQGAPYNFAANVLVVLSTDGGNTWTHPHLLGRTSDSSGGFTVQEGIEVKWLAAALGPTLDNNVWQNTHTYPIHVTWNAAGQQWYQMIEYDLMSQDIANFGSPPFGVRRKLPAQFANAVKEPTLAVRDFVNSGGTTTQPLLTYVEVESDMLDCFSFAQRSPQRQAWHTIDTVDYGATWREVSASPHVEIVPRCVGGTCVGAMCELPPPGQDVPRYRNAMRAWAVWRPSVPPAGEYDFVVTRLATATLTWARPSPCGATFRADRRAVT